MAKSMVEQLEAAKIRIPELEALVASGADEITALKAENADHVEKVTALTANVTELEASLETSKTESAAALEAVNAEKAALETENGDLKAKIEVNPNLGDITKGTDAVPDGSTEESGDEVNHVAELEKIQEEHGKGSKQAIAYYRENKAAIEAADEGDK